MRVELKILKREEETSKIRTARLLRAGKKRCGRELRKEGACENYARFGGTSKEVFDRRRNHRRMVG
jgi:hypothetical protein